MFCDQPWWGERIKQLGVGTHIRFRRLNRTTLEAALRDALRPEVRERAQALGVRIRAEGDGLISAVEAFDEWLLTAEPTPPGRTTRHLRRAAAPPT